MCDGYILLATSFPMGLSNALIADAEQHIFTPPHPRAGGAFAMASLNDQHAAPHRAAAWLAEAAQREGIHDFVPNEASYQRYLPDGNGLPPHRDQRYYASCIAIVTLQGVATFAIHASRAYEDVVTQWTTQPGQVILLRGWQADNSRDPRPYHRIDPPFGEPRLMFQVRHNLAAATPPSPLLDTLTKTEVDQAIHLAARPAAPRRENDPRF
ncbi:hypothetical protein [Pseudonocardia alaniniphila]|uniref:Fe2OG dioxygenase domain-containing protein n=1 Tax=Pseudonocardia alaniniphila TaxID=75291 RepID=A0ABS9T8W9_9PSEU|nr:hypothetical protein [Pseudonocardia alaniniphila]MCH6164972.1 hypothetical protein [Pseudonocardia alaniniphila]